MKQSPTRPRPIRLPRYRLPCATVRGIGLLLGLSLLALVGGCGPDDASSPGPSESPALPRVPDPANHGDATPAPGARTGALVQRDLLVALIDPTLVAVGEPGSSIGDADVVFSLVGADEARAYPMRQLAYHAVINTSLDGRAVLITYSVLSGQVRVFDAAGKRGPRQFGVAGFRGRDLLLYDRRTQSMWDQATGTCLDGFRVGEQLKRLKLGSEMPWKRFRAEHPRGLVLPPTVEFADRYFPAGSDWSAPRALPPGLRGRSTTAPAPERFHVEPDLFATLDRPKTVDVGGAAHLEDTDEVLGLSLGGSFRAYPAYILSYFHAVNDEVAGQSVFVTFCTVCSSGAAYAPRVVGEARTLSFGFEGILDGLPVYYDRQTHSRWKHLTGACFEGWFAGSVLAEVGHLRYTTWGEWRRAHPTTTAIDVPINGLPGDYGQKFDTYRGAPFVPDMMRRTMRPADARLAPNTLLYGLAEGDDVLAVPFERIRKKGGALEIRWRDEPLVLLLHPTYETVVAVVPKAAGRRLHLSWRKDGALTDRETGSTWGLDGRGITGPLQGQRLTIASGTQVEWYGWSAVHPRTRIWDRD